MNLNVDGTPLTTSQLLVIAAETGYDMQSLHNELTAMHSASMSRSHLDFITRAARFQAWTEGKLAFRTQLHQREFTEKVVCKEILDFLVTS